MNTLQISNYKSLNIFGKRLARILHTKEWTQQQLAEKLDTTQQSISRWINGKTEPTIIDILFICFYLNQSPNELLGFNDITPNEFKKFDELFSSKKKSS